MTGSGDHIGDGQSQRPSFGYYEIEPNDTPPTGPRAPAAPEDAGRVGLSDLLGEDSGWGLDEDGAVADPRRRTPDGVATKTLHDAVEAASHPFQGIEDRLNQRAHDSQEKTRPKLVEAHQRVQNNSDGDAVDDWWHRRRRYHKNAARVGFTGEDYEPDVIEAAVFKGSPDIRRRHKAKAALFGSLVGGMTAYDRLSPNVQRASAIGRIATSVFAVANAAAAYKGVDLEVGIPIFDVPGFGGDDGDNIADVAEVAGEDATEATPSDTTFVPTETEDQAPLPTVGSETAPPSSEDAGTESDDVFITDGSRPDDPDDGGILDPPASPGNDEVVLGPEAGSGAGDGNGNGGDEVRLGVGDKDQAEESTGAEAQDGDEAQDDPEAELSDDHTLNIEEGRGIEDGIEREMEGNGLFDEGGLYENADQNEQDDKAGMIRDYMFKKYPNVIDELQSEGLIQGADAEYAVNDAGDLQLTEEFRNELSEFTSGEKEITQEMIDTVEVADNAPDTAAEVPMVDADDNVLTKDNSITVTEGEPEIAETIQNEYGLTESQAERLQATVEILFEEQLDWNVENGWLEEGPDGTYLATSDGETFLGEDLRAYIDSLAKDPDAIPEWDAINAADELAIEDAAELLGADFSQTINVGDSETLRELLGDMFSDVNRENVDEVIDKLQSQLGDLGGEAKGLVWEDGEWRIDTETLSNGRMEVSGAFSDSLDWTKNSWLVQKPQEWTDDWWIDTGPSPDGVG